MRIVFKRLAISVIAVLVLALPVAAGPLDDYYLGKYGENAAKALERAVFSSVVPTVQAIRSGTPLKHALSRDWKQLEPATQKVLAKQLAAPVISGTTATLLSSGGHFTIHYAVSGSDAPSLNDYTVSGVVYPGINSWTGLGLTSSADWAAKVGDAFETAYTFYKNLGYHMPPSNPYDVYLISLASASEYGETGDIATVSSSGFPYASSSFISIDKDFTNPIFSPQTYSPLQSLQVTSAHEFHHAIQYGYNYYFDIWYAEATSTWYESEIWPAVKQNYEYLPGWFENSTVQMNLPQTDARFSSQAYGRWIFNRYLAEQHGASVVQSVWSTLAPMAPSGGQDIPMAPILDAVLAANYNSSLSAEFFGFAKRVYTRDWTTTSAITTSDISLITQYTPDLSYSSYPNGSVAPSITLPHYSFAYYKFTPSAATATLTITLNKTSGIQTAAWKKAGGTVSEIAVNSGDGSYTVSGFGTLDPATDEVVLLVANTGSTDNQSVNASTTGTTTGTTASTSASSGGGGCFIATAAYGSYLHPKVAELRAFRDHYLLTNAPGRLFVALYYRMSPPIANIIAEHEWMRAVVRVALTPVIFAVEHPGVALLLFLLALGGLFWRSVRRGRVVSFA
jgi:hypothetical protein